MGSFFEESTEPQKKSIIEQYEKILFTKPSEAPNGSLCALFLGDDGTAKSGASLCDLSEEEIKEGKKVVIVDLDSGVLPLITAYHLDNYMNGSIIHFDPLRWDEKDGEKSAPDYEATINEVNNVGLTLQHLCKKYDVKLVIFDGVSNLLKNAEMKMREDNGLDDIKNTSFDFKYYKDRRKVFNDTLQLYKSLPVDKIFIAHPDLAIPRNPNPEKPPSSVKIDLNAMVSQRVRFRTESDTKGNEKYFAKVDKNKSNILTVGEEVCFAQTMLNKKGKKTFEWHPEKVFELLRRQKE